MALLHVISDNTPLALSHSSSDRAGSWFLRSGIQAANGGVARYYRSDTGRNARTSTEITGYAVSTLVYLHRTRRDDSYRSAAVEAADFLTKTAWLPKLGSFPFEHSEGSAEQEQLAYFFDIGIIIRGLLAAWHLTGDPAYFDVSVKAGLRLAADFREGAQFHPVITLPGKQPLPWGAAWSRSPGCYQLKSALAWHDLYEATGDSQFLHLYEHAFRVAMAAKDEFLPAETEERTMDRLHAYCYFLEGLFPFVDRPETQAALSEGVDRVSRYLRQIARIFERSDVYAQLLRVRLLADSLGKVTLSRDAAEEEADCISGFQLEHADPRISGGFWFGKKAGHLLPFVNPVSSAFCLQALDMWRGFQTGARLGREFLI